MSVLPALEQLAFALTLQRSKPDNISFREYIVNLRKFITPSTISTFLSTKTGSWAAASDFTVDAAGYWRNFAQSLSAGRTSLENKIAELEKTTVYSNVTRSADGPEPSAPPPKRRCRAKTWISGLRVDDIFLEDVARVADGSNARLFSCMAEIQKIYNEPNPDMKALREVLLQTCRAICDILEDLVKKYSAASAPIDRRMTDAWFKALARACVVVLQGARNLRGSDGAAGGRLVYAVVTLFRQVVVSIENALSEITSCPDSDGSLFVPRTTELLQLKLATVAYTFISHLGCPAETAPTSSAKTAHARTPRVQPPESAMKDEILEGVLYILLTRAGELVYILTFAGPRAASLAEEIASNRSSDESPGSVEVDNKDQDGGVGDTENNKCDDKGRGQLAKAKARHEARYLFPLLARAISAREACTTSNDVAVGRGSSVEHSATVSSKHKRARAHQDDEAGNEAEAECDLASLEMRKLQNTLIAGIFGSVADGLESVDEQSTLRDIQSCLSQYGPGTQGEVEDGSAAKKTDLPHEWFVLKMWEMVGWDRLADAITQQFM